MRLLDHRPSPAMVVASAALFVALGGVGIAATGGNFILGQPNSAGSKTSLTAGISDRALAITNNNTGAGAAALALNVASGHPPLVASPGAGTAPHLSADKLDGVDSSGFVRGRGRIVSNHVREPADGVQRTLVELPGIGVVKTTCLTSNSMVESRIEFFNTSGTTGDLTLQRIGDSQPGFFVLSSGESIGYVPSVLRRGVLWQFNRDAEASGPVSQLTTMEVPAADATHCLEQVSAVVQTG
jgi:hypothetical protein